ncbi:MAG: class A sortase [Streptococcaceae bacterium]|nr:class A sortase [Streptococcaceae bacterium]
MMRKGNVNIFVVLVIDALLMLGIILIFLPYIKNSLIGISVTQNRMVQVDTIPKNIPDEEKIQPIKLADVFNRTTQVKNVYGSIGIESLDWEEPLLIGITNENLSVGGVVFYPERTVDRHNVVIAGHHLGITQLLFGPLTKAKVGDIAHLVYLKTEAFYQITAIKEVVETDLSVLRDNGKSELTLITCKTPQRTNQRLVLQGKKISITTAQQLRKEAPKQKQGINQATYGVVISWIWIAVIWLLIIIVISLKHYLLRKIK